MSNAWYSLIHSNCPSLRINNPTPSFPHNIASDVPYSILCEVRLILLQFSEEIVVLHFHLDIWRTPSHYYQFILRMRFHQLVLCSHSKSCRKFGRILSRNLTCFSIMHITWYEQNQVLLYLIDTILTGLKNCNFKNMLVSKQAI